VLFRTLPGAIRWFFLTALIVGVVFAIIAFVMIKKGMSDLELSSLAPTRTAKNVKRDAQAVKGVYDEK
jgi:Na+-transporting methylmalonyl-CoA/oxaloacetate decarboxylase gamma subunit